MSSECVCHTDEWCFYCEMYAPLEEENERLKLSIKEAATKLENAIKLYQPNAWIARMLKEVVDDLRRERAGRA